jgi:hypothetical protein
MNTTTIIMLAFAMVHQEADCNGKLFPNHYS